MKYILALDQGTTSSRAIVFNKVGEAIATAQKEFEQIFPEPGLVEHRPDEIWSTQMAVATEVLGRANVRPRDIAALGITNQRETVVVWDRNTGEPIHNAIVWQDRRTAAYCDGLKRRGLEETVREKTGLLLDPYFSASKVAWLLENIDGTRKRAEAGELCLGTIDSWLAYKLSGGVLHITDVSNASRTLLYDIHSQSWDEELLELFGIPASMLPEVRASSEVYTEVATSLGLSGIPLASLVGDQQAASIGQVCFDKGASKCTYGTGCFLMMNTGSQPQLSTHKLLTTVLAEREKSTTYALEGAVFMGGAVVQWLRDGLQLIKTSSDVEALAEMVSDTGGVYLVPAHAGLGAPYWDSYARGTICGLSRGSNAGHIARAALEGIAFQVADVVRAMEKDNGETLKELRVDGGAAANDLLMQLQADLLQCAVVRPKTLETTALGAAYMAGLAVGFWDSEQEIVANWQVERCFEPQITTKEAETRTTRWQEAVSRSLDWAK